MKNLAYLFLLFLLAACGTAKNASVPRRLAPDKMQADYDLFRQILEEAHPGLYWYTSKDSMDQYFDAGRSLLKDSLPEVRFRNVLSHVIAQIGCGHTTVRPSAAYVRARLRPPQFPLILKIWPDTAYLLRNLDAGDSLLDRGSIITAIDGRPMPVIIDSLFDYLSTDGYNRTHRYQTLSNGGVFGGLYPLVFGYKTAYNVSYIDSVGDARKSSLRLFQPVRDTTQRVQRLPGERPSRRERKKMNLSANRSMHIDTSLRAGIMELHTFSKGFRLRSFYRQSFRELDKKNVPNMVIDLRSNGGGSVTNSNLLTKYISDHRFKIADSLYAIQRSGNLRKYQKDHFWSWLFLKFMTRKKDGRYHFRYFEKKYFAPKKRHHFKGNVYVLTGGNSFSAATLFTSAVRAQENVVQVGEETGGGAHGNNAWLIPDVTLPNTKVRFRLPLFRLVIDKDQPRGFGVQPEVFAGPTVDALNASQDYKMEKVKELIRGGDTTCLNVIVQWHSDPAADGMGWVLVNEKNEAELFIPENLPHSWKKEGLRGKACLLRTGKTAPCHCIKPPPLYRIKSIVALQQ